MTKMSADEITRRYAAAKTRLTEEAAAIALARPDDYAGAARSPANAVELTLDALWQWPALAQLLADYFNAVAAVRSHAAEEVR